jgi:serine/threonine-protein kinase
MKCPKCQHENPADTSYCGRCGASLHVPQKDDAHLSPTPRAGQGLLTGSLFHGRYRVIEEIGKGGMGRVYKVFDERIKEKIALKLLKPEIAFEEKTIERFRNEIRIARRIVHRNVGRMFDLGEDDGTTYITMEYVHGQDLKALIRQAEALPIGKAVSIARQVCEGLVEAHREGVVHRDLKSGNIMIDKEGNADHGLRHRPLLHAEAHRRQLDRQDANTYRPGRSTRGSTSARTSTPGRHSFRDGHGPRPVRRRHPPVDRLQAQNGQAARPPGGESRGPA